MKNYNVKASYSESPVRLFMFLFRLNMTNVIKYQVTLKWLIMAHLIVACIICSCCRHFYNGDILQAVRKVRSDKKVLDEDL